MRDDDLVTIATFPEPAGAAVARAALESAGIDAFLNGENANGLLPVAFTSQLQVRAVDEAAARSVLDAEPMSEAAVIDAEQADEDAREA